MSVKSRGTLTLFTRALIIAGLLLVVILIFILLPQPTPPGTAAAETARESPAPAPPPGRLSAAGNPAAPNGALQGLSGERPATTHGRGQTAGPRSGPEPDERGDPRRRAYLRRQAEESLHETDALKTRLIAQQVRLWGAKTFAQVTQLLAQGDDQMTAASYAAAVQSYGQATGLMKTLESLASDVLARNLKDGAQALAAGDKLGAAAAFDLAAQIDPDSTAAATGKERAAVLDQVLPLLQAGRRQARQGRIEAAILAYRQAVRLDPHSPGAQAQLHRLEEELKTQRWNHLMSQGLLKLQDGDLAAARQAFIEAGRLRPDDPGVRDGLARVETAQEDRDTGRLKTAAEELEKREAWKEAALRYQQILQIDPAVRFAQEGVERTQRRADLADRMDFHLSHPGRLASGAVLEEVKQLMEEASRVVPQGPVQQHKLHRLQQLVSAAEHPVTVTLLSDNLTQVTIYQVGSQGSFLRRDVELRPGLYTVVGTRRGFRDVRRQLQVDPGRAPAPILVRCEEEI